jgi:hypothetical protein
VRSRTARIVAAAVSAATTLAACSGGPSKEDFIAAADDVCREADERVAEIGRLRSEDDIAEYVEQTKEVSVDLVSSLRELEAPEADQARFEDMIDGIERATDLLGPMAQAVIERREDGFDELQQELGQIAEDVNDFAESYGFEVCGAKVLEPVR